MWGGLEGGIVSSSRGVLYPDGADTTDAKRWECAIDDAIERATTDLRNAVAAP